MQQVPFNQLADFFEEDFERINDELLTELEKRMKLKTPVLSGRLKDGWKVEGNSVINDVEYAGYVEMGTVHQRPVGMMSSTLLEVDDILETINSHNT